MTKKHSNKFVWTVVALVIAAAAGLGYYTNSLQLREENSQSANAAEAADDHEHAATPELPYDASVLDVRSDDIIIGSADAKNTLVEYSSLSCPHCAHFHKEMLPEIKKQLIDTGKARHVVRYFPLNLPALRGAMLVECGSKAKRLELLEELYATQDTWAFTPQFLEALKTIGGKHGIDAAAFDSCMADNALEAKILNNRKEGMEKLHIKGTPSFFINGKPLELKGGLTTESFIKAVESPVEPKAEAPAETPAETK